MAAATLTFELASSPVPNSAATLTSGLTASPAPQRASLGAADRDRGLRLSGLLRRVIDYGKELLITVRLRAAASGVASLAKPFGTTDVQRIIARLTAAIARAAQLDEGVLRQCRPDLFLPQTRSWAAADPTPSPGRPEEALAARHSEDRPGARPGEARGERPGEPCGERQDIAAARRQPAASPGGRWLSAAAIAAQIRGLSFGAVLAGICHDLGITPHHPLWPQLSRAITEYGGDLAVFAPVEPMPGGEGHGCSLRWLEDRGAGYRDTVLAERWMSWTAPATAQSTAEAMARGMAEALAEASTGPP